MIYNLQSIQSGGVSPNRVKEPVPYWFLYSLILSRVPAYGISPGYRVCVSNRCQGLGLVGTIQWDRTDRLFGFGPSQQFDAIILKAFRHTALSLIFLVVALLELLQFQINSVHLIRPSRL